MTDRLSKAFVIGVLFVAVTLTGCVTTLDGSVYVPDIDKAGETHVTAGLEYLSKGEKEFARRHFQSALDISDMNAPAHNGMAIVYQQDKDDELAEKHFKRALQLDPNFSKARFNYSGFLIRTKRFSEAQENLLILVEDVTYPRRDFASLQLGLLQQKAGDYDAALDSFQNAVGVNFRLAAAHEAMAGLYFEKKKYPLAAQSLNQYNKIRRGRPSAKSLWLKIRLEQIFDDKNKEASAVMALKNMYPYSEEYLEYKKSIKQ